MENKKSLTANAQPKKHKLFWTLALWFVVIVWGVNPVVTDYLTPKFLSASMYQLIVCSVAVLSLIIINWKKLKLLNKKYFIIAGSTGLFVAVAELIQKIGLPYTTPTRYAFLETLSVAVVPVLTFFFVGQKPSIIKIVSAMLCLAGSFILSGDFSSGLGIGIGEILCALAGVFYGVNIAATGVFANDLDSSLYVMIQLGVQVLVGGLSAVILGLPAFGGNFAETFRVEFNFATVSLLLASALCVTTLCWLIRTNAMKHIDPVVVAIIMPCSAIITGLVSVIAGTDVITSTLIIGGVIGFGAVILSGLDDVINPQRKRKQAEENL